MRFDRDTFGPHLRRERERRGITLDDITARTKIGRSLLVNLERGEVAAWPKGIFRRAFFRDYASAIGVDADALLGEFLRLFPDPSADPAPADVDAAPPQPSDLRLTLAVAAPVTGISRAKPLSALADTLAILVATAIVSAAIGHPAAVAAAIAIVYHACATIWSGRTLGAYVAAHATSYARSGEPSGRQARVPRIDARRGEPSRRSRGHRRVVDAAAIRGTQAVS